MHPAILLQDSLVVFMWVIFALACLGLIGVITNQFILPYIRIKALELPDPINTGDSFDFVVEETARQARFSIGKKIGNVRTLVAAVSEDHLVFEFKKNRDNEEYTITIYRNGAVLFKPPRMDTYSKMESKEKMEGYEIIGHSADFRISDKYTKDRMVNFVEIRLSSSFFFNKVGKERMKFTFTILKIQPGLDRIKRNRDGSFAWGQETDEESEEEARESTNV
ncbi:MAG: hypothetical protein JJT78_11370 [Leptospira sp.]|nr:hypothetical protein [Leptospira sp.]